MIDNREVKIGINFHPKEVDGLDIKSFAERHIKLKSADKLSKKEFDKICQDHKLIGQLLSQQPDLMREIFDDVLSGRHSQARKKARTIDFTEEAFQDKGGGVIWWIVAAVVVGIMLYSADAM